MTSAAGAWCFPIACCTWICVRRSLAARGQGPSPFPSPPTCPGGAALTVLLRQPAGETVSLVDVDISQRGLTSPHPPTPPPPPRRSLSLLGTAPCLSRARPCVCPGARKLSVCPCCSPCPSRISCCCCWCRCFLGMGQEGRVVAEPCEVGREVLMSRCLLPTKTSLPPSLPSPAQAGSLPCLRLWKGGCGEDGTRSCSVEEAPLGA